MSFAHELPKTDLIRELAEFWDTHDLTDFEDELEEVAEPIFVRGSSIKVHLESPEAEAVQQMAQAKGISREELIHSWVLENSLTKPMAAVGNARVDQYQTYPYRVTFSI